jgi:hypothetical protein
MRVRDEGSMSQTTSRNSAPANRNQFDEARAHLEKVIVEGLRHGFFECVIACEIGRGDKRQLVIRAGKSHKFTIPEEEVP